ncbi:winged helix-turn-helix transcriptional regulator [Rhizobium sp. ARZ01]|uniref:MarR family winged helix-turn-helix transcriptional regulator n=1 Tax=Rhizobium sp. ARZ01 TaxID=2769313 RepID=UPI00177AD458|nr:MarR family winged helix-turn-helix transcriptional regulator [Rhizobium sp. ARZ01]MBD9374381.1 winged helix-turn-helix transcriptional regulator [Rhizobium sp. ARZ01]
MSKRTNLPSAEVTRAWINLMRAQRSLLTAIENDLRSAGQPPLGWYDVLWELDRAGDGRLRPYEIEERTLLAQYNLSRLIDRLEREGLVKRETFDQDGRGRWVVITEKGRSVRAAMWDIYGRSIQAHIGERLGEDKAAMLAALLSRLT